ALNYFSLGLVQLLQTRINAPLLEIVQRHFDENVSVFGFRDPELVVEFLQSDVVRERRTNETETCGPAAFDDGREQQTVEKSVERVGTAKREKRPDVGIFADFFSQADA